MDSMTNAPRPKSNGHCWHEVGSQRDPERKCCWCGINEVTVSPGHHGNKLGFTPTETRKHTDEVCTEHMKAITQDKSTWVNNNCVGGSGCTCEKVGCWSER